MTNNSTSSIQSIALSDDEKTTLRVGAYGAVSLMSAAGVAGGKPHRIATDGSIALASATGQIGHVLAKYPKGRELNGKSVAALADRVLPALTEAMSLLKRQDAAEAEHYRAAVVVAIKAASHSHKGELSPTMVDMTHKITEALDAA
ncbi:MAG TPA: hypothetical protein VE172_11585 [Stackebrandtia sp.]|jgi:hypothetical protein|uniref:hypothetical protein n=1 Tax=Stackebrandtia sp. TaxID=2023065 RepID=UPI002D55F945|nr:hypothetical protein [Stackebrandtia sp.]HZE39439.1 hypothetical protein [Stackebrandtia sp.]